jgi:hypothetical protein
MYPSYRFGPAKLSRSALGTRVEELLGRLARISGQFGEIITQLAFQFSAKYA